MSIVDFSQLAPPQIIETLDFEQLYEQRKQALIDLYIDSAEKQYISETLSRDSDPLAKFLQENCYREMILRNRINHAAQSLLLAYASGSDLENLAANFNVQRLIITPEDMSKIPPLPAVMESDEKLRLRTQQAFDKLSVAGPESAYKKFAYDADGRVADVSVISPNPAYITVSILQADSETGVAAQELINIVSDALNAEEVRPIGDRVTVQSAAITRYNIQAKLYISKEPEAATLLEQVRQNLYDYAYQRNRIGKSIRLSALYSALHIAGVSRVELISPKADIVINDQQAAFCTSINVSIGGVE